MMYFSNSCSRKSLLMHALDSTWNSHLCVGSVLEDSISPDWDYQRFKKKHFTIFQRLHLSSLQCLRTLNVILIHENPTLFYVCVDPGVVSGGLSVRPVLRSLWMERSLSIFSESQSWGEPPRAD